MVNRSGVLSILSNIKNILVEKFFPYKIIVFGSYTTSDFNKDSDLDLCIIMDTDDPRYIRNYKLLMALKKIKYPLDVIVYTPSELSDKNPNLTNFEKDILNNGIVIYEKI